MQVCESIGYIRIYIHFGAGKRSGTSQTSLDDSYQRVFHGILQSRTNSKTHSGPVPEE